VKLEKDEKVEQNERVTQRCALERQREVGPGAGDLSDWSQKQAVKNNSKRKKRTGKRGNDDDNASSSRTGKKTKIDRVETDGKI